VELTKWFFLDYFLDYWASWTFTNFKQRQNFNSSFLQAIWIEEIQFTPLGQRNWSSSQPQRLGKLFLFSWLSFFFFLISSLFFLLVLSFNWIVDRFHFLNCKCNQNFSSFWKHQQQLWVRRRFQKKCQDFLKEFLF